MFGGKLSLSGEMVLLLGVHYYFRLTPVYYVKSTKQVLAGVRPPPPSWQCQDFHCFYYGHRSLKAAVSGQCGDYDYSSESHNAGEFSKFDDSGEYAGFGESFGYGYGHSGVSGNSGESDECANSGTFAYLVI